MSAPVSLSKELIRQKSKGILADLERLRQMLAKSAYEIIVSDETLHTLAERRLERIINRALDINFHLIRAADSPPPDDYTQSFLLLADLKILTPQMAKALAPAAGARNVLIHAYDDLDSKRFYTSLEDAVRFFPEYLKAIERFLEKA